MFSVSQTYSAELNHSHLFFPIFFSHHLSLKTMKPIALYKHNGNFPNLLQPSLVIENYETDSALQTQRKFVPRTCEHKSNVEQLSCAKTNRRDTFHCEEPEEVLAQTPRFELRESRLLVFELPLSSSLLFQAFIEAKSCIELM